MVNVITTCLGGGWNKLLGNLMSTGLVLSGRYELICYQDKLSGGVFTAAAFILLLFTQSKPTITATITTSRSRRVTSTPAATEAAVFEGTAEQIVYIYHMQFCNKEILLHKLYCA